jgi:hypothetical protein
MQKIKNSILAVLALALLMVPVMGTLSNPVAAATNAKQEVCEGLGTGANCSGAGQPSINNTISNVIDLMSAITGVVSVIMIIIAGFRFVTANGDSGTIAAARRTVIYALVGLVVVVLSQTLVKYVVDRVA